MKNKKIILSLLLVGATLNAGQLRAACTEDQFINDFDAFSNVPVASKTATVCDQQVTITSLSGIAIQDTHLNDAGDLASLLYYQKQNVALNGPVEVRVNGNVIYTGSIVTPTDFFYLLQALQISVAHPYLSATSMASTSSSARVTDTIYSRVINPVLQTRSQRQQSQQKATQFNAFLGDVKYEHGDFRRANDSGHVAGFTAGASYDFNDQYSIGVVIPYDHMAFSSFDANRTGVILYGKGKWNFSNNFELDAAINGNYLYTDMQFKFGKDQLHTYGGGLSTRLTFDNGGDFIPAVALSIQYNRDDKNFSIDNQQILVKAGTTLGYRILDNALIQVSGAYNRGITVASVTGGNADDDFFDAGIEGSWLISDTWQLKGGFKKVLGLNYYDSDSFYLGSSIKF